MSQAARILLILSLTWSVQGMCPTGCVCMGDIIRCFAASFDSIPRTGLPPRARLLDIRYNTALTHLGKNAFSAFRHVHILLLSNNAIESIDSEAFQSLEDVQYIYLHMNRFEEIPANAFKGLNKLKFLSLFGNELASIGSDAFDGCADLLTLQLHQNKLQTLDQRLFDTAISLNKLRIENNPFVCNCSMLWLRTFQPVRNSGSRPLCDTPPSLMRRDLFSLTTEDLGCGPPVVTPGSAQISGGLGDQIRIDCPHRGSPAPAVQWLHDDIMVQMLGKYSMLPNGSLMIGSLNAEDAGMYTCLVFNVFGRAQLDITVSFTGELVKPTIINVPSMVTVARGSSTSLTCTARSNPKGVIVWEKDGRPLPQNGRFLADSNSYKLRIFDVEHSDAGMYTCTVTNQLGSDQATITVIVREAPVIVGGPSEVDVVIGQSVRLQCNNSGQPRPAIVWIRNNLQLEVGGRVFIDPVRGQLEILNAVRGDSGLYVCRAINDLGSTSHSVQVVVRAPRLPIFSKRPQNTSTPIGGSFSLECRAQLFTSMSWLHNSAPVVLGGRVSRSGIALVVSNATEADEGEYTCLASNSDGQVRASANVNIVGDLISCNGILTTQQLNSIRNDVNSAFDNLLRSINSTGQQSPSKLLMLLRLPNAGTIEISKAAEIFSEAIQRVETNSSLSVKSLHSNASVQLSECELHFLASLSGCKAHTTNASCSTVCRHSKYRSVDGTCNNLKHVYYGAAVVPFTRLLEADYENDINLPRGWKQSMNNPFSGPKPSARLISSSLLSSREVTHDRRYTLMLMQLGQFLDHDLDIAPTVPSDRIFRNGSKCSELCGTEPPCFPIMVPPNDTRIRNRKCMSFTRSSAVCGSGSGSALVGRAAYRREQINDITSFTDASMVYGSNQKHAEALRDKQAGRGLLLAGPESSPGKHFLVYDNNSFVECQQPSDSSRPRVSCFLGGDVRTNEQVGLSTMHTVFMREHNRLATSLHALNPHWSDEKIYQEARQILGGQWQHIVYTEYLPVILGESGMRMLGEYNGYNESVNPTILNSFATAAYRFGHSQILPFLPRLDESWQETADGHLPLFNAFFSPFRIVQEGGIDPLLRGLLATPAKMRSAEQAVSSVVTERLFQETHQVALDLAALNIQRGRDHGLPGYNQFRAFCGLAEADSFDDLASEIPQEEIRNTLQQLYGHPDNIDLFVGGILEEVLEDAQLGPTFSCIIVEQFKRLRDGDRFFYLNPGVFTSFQLQEIRKASLSKIICNNADNIPTVPRKALALQNVPDFVQCSDLDEPDLSVWLDCEVDKCTCPSRKRRDLESVTVSEGFSSYTKSHPFSLHKSLDKTVSTSDKSEVARLKKIVNSLEEQISEMASTSQCMYNGMGYKPGSKWSLEKGMSCICQVGGSVNCSFEMM
nr:peroxidase-like protein 6 [Halisarca dujardinii]